MIYICHSVIYIVIFTNWSDFVFANQWFTFCQFSDLSPKNSKVAESTFRQDHIAEQTESHVYALMRQMASPRTSKD